MIAAAFQIPHKIITGYSGSQSALAMMRGEVDVLMGGEDSADTYARAGQLRTVMMVGGHPPAGVANAMDYAKTPRAKSIMRLMASMGELSRITAGPPGIPADRLTALRTAFKEALESKALKEAAAKAGRGIEPAYGEDVQKMVVDLMDQPPEIVAMLNATRQRQGRDGQAPGADQHDQARRARAFHQYRGKNVGTKVSGSRTTITINGKMAKRKAIKTGMTCIFTYPGPGKEAKRVDCKN